MSFMRKFALGSGVVASTVGLFFAYKVNFTAPVYTGDERLVGKVVVLTGASSGIGYDLSRRFASRGATLYMLSHNFAKCEKVRGKLEIISHNRRLYCRECDLASLDSVRRVATEIAARERRVDVLVNNAAVKCPVKREVTKDGIEMQLGVNHLAHFLLTDILLPKLRQSAEARLIFVTCLRDAELPPFNFDDLNWDASFEPAEAYRRSKHASLLHMKELLRRLGQENADNVHVMAADPGLCFTEIDRRMPHNNNFMSRGIFFLVSTILLRSAIQGSQSILQCALKPEAAAMSGKCFKDLEDMGGVLDSVGDEEARRLWLISERWTTPRE